MQGDGTNLDVLYFTSEGNLERLLVDFGRTSFSFPVVSYGDTHFELQEGTISDELMHGVLSRASQSIHQVGRLRFRSV